MAGKDPQEGKPREPSLLHEHVDLSISTMFREHTALGEAFEAALAEVLTEASPPGVSSTRGQLKDSLRDQFAKSVQTVLNEVEETCSPIRSDLQKKHASNVSATSNSGATLPRVPRKAEVVEISASIRQYSGKCGTFHFQTEDGGKLCIPTKSKYALLPRNDIESHAAQLGLPLSIARQNNVGKDIAKCGHKTVLTERIGAIDVWCAKE